MAQPKLVASIAEMPGAAALQDAVDANPGLIAGAVADASGMLVVWGPGCSAKTLNGALAGRHATHIWRAVEHVPGTQDGSKTSQAVLQVRTGKATPNAAARAVGISPSAVYRALARAAAPCPCCGRPANQVS